LLWYWYALLWNMTIGIVHVVILCIVLYIDDIVLLLLLLFSIVFIDVVVLTYYILQYRVWWRYSLYDVVVWYWYLVYYWELLYYCWYGIYCVIMIHCFVYWWLFLYLVCVFVLTMKYYVVFCIDTCCYSLRNCIVVDCIYCMLLWVPENAMIYVDIMNSIIVGIQWWWIDGIDDIEECVDTVFSTILMYIIDVLHCCWWLHVVLLMTCSVFAFVDCVAMMLYVWCCRVTVVGGNGTCYCYVTCVDIVIPVLVAVRDNLLTVMIVVYSHCYGDIIVLLLHCCYCCCWCVDMLILPVVDRRCWHCCVDAIVIVLCWYPRCYAVLPVIRVVIVVVVGDVILLVVLMLKKCLLTRCCSFCAVTLAE